MREPHKQFYSYIKRMKKYIYEMCKKDYPDILAELEKD